MSGFDRHAVVLEVPSEARPGTYLICHDDVRRHQHVADHRCQVLKVTA